MTKRITLEEAQKQLKSAKEKQKQRKNLYYKIIKVNIQIEELKEKMTNKNSKNILTNI